jgi:hypothetical protein
MDKRKFVANHHGSGLSNNRQSRGRHRKLRWNISHQMDTSGMRWETGDISIIISLNVDAITCTLYHHIEGVWT